MNIFEDFRAFEPVSKNRFIISTEGTQIPSFLFRKFKIYNEGENLILKTKFLQTVDFIFNPADFIKIMSLKIEYLDPTGIVIGGYSFEIKGINFSIKEDYSNDGLSTVKLRFIIDPKTIVPLFKNNNQ